MLEGKPASALTVSSDDQRSDFDDLAVAAGGRTGVAPRAGDVLLRRGSLADVRCHDGEQGVRDRAHQGDRVVSRMATRGLRRSRRSGSRRPRCWWRGGRAVRGIRVLVIGRWCVRPMREPLAVSVMTAGCAWRLTRG